MPAAVAIATGNPKGLTVVGGMKVYGEASGRNKLEERAKATADAIAAELKIRFRTGDGSRELRGRTEETITQRSSWFLLSIEVHISLK